MAKIRTAPMFVKILKDEGIDPADVMGTGPGGKITSKDVGDAIRGKVIAEIQGLPFEEQERLAIRGELPEGVSYSDICEAPETVEVEMGSPKGDDSQAEADAYAQLYAPHGDPDVDMLDDRLKENLRYRDEAIAKMDKARDEARRLTSRPWTERRSPNRLAAPRRTGWVRRWVHERRVQGFLQMTPYPWQIASMKRYGAARDPRLAALVGQGTGDTFVRNNLILLEIPTELNAKNREMYQKQAALNATSATDQAIAAGATRTPGHFGGTRKDLNLPIKRTGPVGSWT